MKIETTTGASADGSKRSRPVPPSALSIATYWSERQTPWGKDVDIESPQCFACGYFRPDDRNGAWKTWEKAAKGTLEKAHIIPWSIKQGNDVSDYVLLCRDCHLLAPNLGTPEPMFQWMRQCPGSFFDTHWTKAQMIAQTASELSVEFDDAVIDAFKAVCVCGKQALFETAAEALGGSSWHFGETINAATHSAISRKILQMIAERDAGVVQLLDDSRECDCMNEVTV